MGLTCSFQPCPGTRFQGYCQYGDGILRDVIEDAHFTDAKAILRFGQPAQTLDSTLAGPSGLMTQVSFDSISYIGRAQQGPGSSAAADSYRSFLEIKKQNDPDPLVDDARGCLSAY